MHTHSVGPYALFNCLVYVSMQSDSEHYETTVWRDQESLSLYLPKLCQWDKPGSSYKNESKWEKEGEAHLNVNKPMCWYATAANYRKTKNKKIALECFSPNFLSVIKSSLPRDLMMGIGTDHPLRQLARLPTKQTPSVPTWERETHTHTLAYRGESKWLRAFL